MEIVVVAVYYCCWWSTCSVHWLLCQSRWRRCRSDMRPSWLDWRMPARKNCWKSSRRTTSYPR